MSKEVKRYEGLRDAAKKATPGPWRIEGDEDSAAGAVYITQDTPDWREPIARLYGWHDQNYLELADPTTILELLSERDALLEEVEKLKRELALWEPVIYEVHRRADKMCCLEEQCDFSVEISYDTYTVIDAGM